MKPINILVIAASIFACTFAPFGYAAEDGYADADTAKLLAALPHAKVSLASGLMQATKGSEVPISAKYEMDDHGKLSLSVYTAEKGLAVEPDKNVLKELAGSPEQASWTPETEVFKDVEHVARSSEHLVLNALSHKPLLAIAKDASARTGGTVYSIAPTLEGRKAIFVVLVAKNDKVSKLTYDIPTGKFLEHK